MNSMWAAALFAGVDFKRGRLFETSDPGLGRELVGGIFSAHLLEVTQHEKHLHLIMDHFSVGNFSLSRLTWNTPVRVDPGWLPDYYLMSIPLKGTAEFRHGNSVFSIRPGDIAIAGGGQRFYFTASPEYDQLVIRLDRRAVDDAWLTLTGRSATGPIIFFGKVFYGDKASQALRPVLTLIADYIKGEWTGVSTEYFLPRLQEMLLLSLLANQPHSDRPSDSDLRLSNHRPQLIKIQDYLMERLEIATSVSDISTATNVPVRTIQWIFKKEIGVGPMEWLREQRLLALKCHLVSDQSNPPKITELACRFHFTHLGDFSGYYRRLFGESPSETRKRAHREN